MTYLFKKADAGLIAVIVIIITMLSLGWITNLASRECSSNKNCNSDEYCGSDFACHQIPVIERTTTITQNNFVLPSIIIGISIVMAALILKYKKLKSRFKKPDEKADILPKEKTKLRTP